MRLVHDSFIARRSVHSVVRVVVRVTYRLVAFDLRVVVDLIAAEPATKVEVFADVANIFGALSLAWRVVPRPSSTESVVFEEVRVLHLLIWIMLMLY